MTRRPGGRLARAVIPAAVCAVLAAAPLWGAHPARSVTPEEAAAAGYVPNPAPALARITIEDVTPQVLDGSAVGGTESGVPTVTVSGTIRNVGDSPLGSVDVRLQRGPRVSDVDAVREPLVWSEPSFPVQGAFQLVAAELEPGQMLPYRVVLPAREVPGSPGPDLQITEPGVYPLLVNVNGTPEGGTPARLDDARTLLPVLEVPGSPAESGGADDGGPDDGGDGGGDDEATGPRPSRPRAVPLTLLWPLAAPPTRIAQVPGENGPDPVVALTDDGLLRDLSPEGRLSGLVRAAQQAFDGAGGAELRRATCLAVDPELLGTASELADGRPVVIDDVAEDGSGRRSRAASGQEEPQVDPETVVADASRWLDQLRALADGGCVVSLPAAQADLDAVARVGNDALTDAALDRGGTVRRVLGVDPVRDLVVPSSGTLDPGTADALGLGRATALVAAPSTRTDTGIVPPAGLVEIADDPDLRALTYPAALGTTLAATGDVPENPRYSDAETRYWLTADSPAARLQDARAALLAPLVGDGGGDGGGDGEAVRGSDPYRDQGVLAVPPAVWTVDGAAAGSLLESLGAQLATGRMRPLPITERLAGPVTVPSGSLAEDPTGAADPGRTDPLEADPGGTTVGRLREALQAVGTLRSLVDTSDPRSATADEHLDPMVGDGLRVLSETGRRADGDGISFDAETGAVARSRTVGRLDRLERTVTTSLGRVDLLPPGSVFTMASPNSPLLLVARNALPIPVRVTIDVTAPQDLHVDPVGVVQIPASGSVTLQVPTQSDTERGGRRTVTFALQSPGGRPLSEPVVLSVQSGGYPLAQVFALGAAALALVLGARRYLRYRRGTPDPADEGHRP